MKTKVVALLCLVVFFLAGCSPAANGNVTSSSSARAEGGKYEGQPPLPETPQQTLSGTSSTPINATMKLFTKWTTFL